jgi:muconolactone delta-isomerase
MESKKLTELRARIQRVQQAVCTKGAAKFTNSLSMDDGNIHSYSVFGVKSPDQLKDELLSLFIWVWSFKDHLKAAFAGVGLDKAIVEEAVNDSVSLQYVADVANAAKHGSLRESRSGKFAELIDVGWSVPQNAMEKISVGAFTVDLHVRNPEAAELYASIKPRGGEAVDAFRVLEEAIAVWETELLPLLS